MHTLPALAEPAEGAPSDARAPAFSRLDWLDESLRPAAQALAREAAYLGETELAECERAMRVAQKAHEGQLRDSGELYLAHPIDVARLLCELRLDGESLRAALLHDTIEDTPLSEEEIEADFGEGVGGMVRALSKIERLRLPVHGAHAKAKLTPAQNLRKMLLAMSKDVRVILIKLADRIHNLSTLDALEPSRRARIVRETEEIYLPLASRLGLEAWSSRIEELCFEKKHPWRKAILQEAMRRELAHKASAFESAQKTLREALDAGGLASARITARRKSLASICAKMREKRLRFSEVLDREGARVIVDSREACYQALGVVHAAFRPLPGSFKDYIALPKVNGYQSLHTAVLSAAGTPFEIQIRSERMHQAAEHGVAMHWLYKEKSDRDPMVNAYLWMQSLLDIQESSADSAEFMEAIKTDLFSDEVYVFTPAGDVVALPRGATAIDFAYAIHSDVGDRLSAARVNGVARPISSAMRSGDIVEALVDERARPARGWLSWAKTGRARAKIREALRHAETSGATRLGEALARQAFLSLGGEEASFAEALETAAKGLGESASALCERVAVGSDEPLAIARLMLGPHSAESGEWTPEPIAIHGDEGASLRFAKCCHPLPPAPVVGLCQLGEPLEVHRQDCPEAGKKQRWLVPMAWRLTAQTAFEAPLRLRARNERGALARIAALIAKAGAFVQDVQVEKGSRKDAYSKLSFVLQLPDQETLDQLEASLRASGLIVGVER
jgi:GTP diphosphokinase / guanosine-3',5'-bis(diphosphate) 3'-diphosphatase